MLVKPRCRAVAFACSSIPSAKSIAITCALDDHSEYITDGVKEENIPRFGDCHCGVPGSCCDVERDLPLSWLGILKCGEITNESIWLGDRNRYWSLKKIPSKKQQKWQVLQPWCGGRHRGHGFHWKRIRLLAWRTCLPLLCMLLGFELGKKDITAWGGSPERRIKEKIN